MIIKNKAMKIDSFLKRQNNSSAATRSWHGRGLIVIAIAMSVLGIVTVASAYTAIPFAASEQENGVITGNALQVTDTSASGSGAVKFQMAAARPAGIYVSGNKLVNGQGDEVILHGVNKMGSEYACIGGWGFFDGPTDQASINVMKTWNINAVRITMNSVCWNNGPTNQFESYNASYAGTNYKNAIKNYVDLLVQNGIHPILDLQWAGCGTGSCIANWIKIMPDRPGAVNFWSDVAATFKDNKAVLFDLYNEPQNPGWQCWRDGGCIAYEGDGAQYTMAGMQELVTAVRAAGATTQPIMLGGLQYSNDVSGWLQYKPTDPNNSLVTSVHLYNFNWPCPGDGSSGAAAAATTITCFTSGYNNIAQVKSANPVIFGELGQDSCDTTFVAPMLSWMYTNHFSVLGWTWHPYDCAGVPSLLADWNGTPSGIGAAFKTQFTTQYPTWGGIK